MLNPLIPSGTFYLIFQTGPLLISGVLGFIISVLFSETNNTEPDQMPNFAKPGLDLHCKPTTIKKILNTDGFTQCLRID